MSNHIATAPLPAHHHRPAQTLRATDLLTAAVVALTPLLAFPATAAIAADLPLKASAAPVHNWTGCYVGANGGIAGSGSSFTSTVNPGTHLVDPRDLAVAGTTGTGSANDGGLIVGGQVGCNLQAGAIVFGVEGDWDSLSSNAKLTNPNGLLTTGDTVTVTQSLKTSSLATVRPRIGIVSDRTLIYVTGGAAFAKVSDTQTYTDTLNLAAGRTFASTTLVGWTAGAGWEWAWTDNLSLKFEYLFAKLPTASALGAINDNAGLINPLNGSADLTVQTARVGINVRF